MFNKVTDIFMNGFLSAGEVVLKNIDKLSFQACLLVGFVALILTLFNMIASYIPNQTSKNI